MIISKNDNVTGSLKVDKIKLVIFDEADEILSSGFFTEIGKIIISLYVET